MKSRQQTNRTQMHTAIKEVLVVTLVVFCFAAVTVYGQTHQESGFNATLVMLGFTTI